MGYLKIHCHQCGGTWDVYSRDNWKADTARQCPHCFMSIDAQTWTKQIIPAFASMDDANRDPAKFTVYGSNDGVGLDMPVTDGASLVGQVCAVSPTTATVRLINDPMFSMSVSVGESGAAGILSGSVDSTVRVDYVSSDDAVSVGDVVRASGRSDVYPKGLAVGTVASVVSEPSSLFQDIVVKPLTQAANASEVFVITAYGAQVDAVSTDQDLESGQSAGDAQ